ncbi:MAG: hypothetical protein MUE81_05000 [Thermoflexibacter sp.]|jgi:hypothetical protein|nr:hypothetical protein [Thermoflexibacter sp.]
MKSLFFLLIPFTFVGWFALKPTQKQEFSLVPLNLYQKIPVSAKFLNTTQIDTIDFWHVYYNKIKIEAYNLNSEKSAITLKIKDIKKTDSLIVKYFKDTPCSKCKTQVTVQDKKHSLIAKGSNKGTFSPLKISVYDLLQYHLKAKEDIYEVFYVEEQEIGQKYKLIFKVRFE